MRSKQTQIYLRRGAAYAVSHEYSHVSPCHTVIQMRTTRISTRAAWYYRRDTPTLPYISVQTVHPHTLTDNAALSAVSLATCASATLHCSAASVALVTASARAASVRAKTWVMSLAKRDAYPVDSHCTLSVLASCVTHECISRMPL